jgi:hypothetical protein
MQEGDQIFVILANARIQNLLLEAGSWLLEAVLQNEPKLNRSLTI